MPQVHRGRGPGFGEAFLMQGRVLRALLLREASLRLGPHRFGHVLVLTEMIWVTTILGIIQYLLEHAPPYGKSAIFYIFTGMFPFTLYRNVHVRVAAAVEANRALFSYPAIRPLDAMLARAGLESAFQITAFLLFYVAFVWFGLADFPVRPVELLQAIYATILLGFAMGVSGMILRSLWKPWETVDSMIGRALFFASGIFYQVEFLPPQIREILVWNPLVHAIEWVRYCIYPEYFTQILDREYLLGWGLAGSVFGLGMERLIRGRLLEGR